MSLVSFAPLVRCPGLNGERCASLIEASSRKHCASCREQITRSHKAQRKAKAGQK